MINVVIYIVVFSILAAIICWKQKDILLWSCCLFLFLSGLGFNINDTYRMGNLMMADIGLIIFGSLMLISKRLINIKMKKYQCYMLLILILYTVIGLVNPIGGIFRDIKNYLYYMIPAFYFSDIKHKKEKLKCLMITFMLIELYTLYLCLYEFLFVKGIAIYDNDVLKFFGIGLGADFLFYAAILLFVNREYVIKKLNMFIWLALELIFVIGAFCSFVRSTWILMLLVTICGLINWKLLNIEKGATLNIRKYIRAILSVMLIIFTFKIILNSIHLDIVSIVIERISSIKIVNIDKTDTLAARLADIYVNKDKMLNPMEIIGYGMGAMMNGVNITMQVSSVENSFMYYFVKFGVLGFAFLSYVVVKYIRRKVKSNNINTQITGDFLVIFLLIEAMSGNLNKYYISPFIMMILILDNNELVKSIVKLPDKMNLSNIKRQSI